MSAIVTYKPLQGSVSVLDPPPFVSQSREDVDAGSMRLGYIENYELDGLYYGSSNSFADFETLSNIFSQSPGVLKIESNNVTILDETGFIVSFSVPKNNFSAMTVGSNGSGILPYNVKFKVFNTLKGIKEPSFEYGFNQNEDKSVNLSVKASAVGVSGIFQAKDFVEDLFNEFNLTGFAPIFITTGKNWSLLSNKKTIDRSKFSYVVEKSYRCQPSGYINDDFYFSETTKVSEQNSPYGADYKSFQFESNLKILADDADKYQKQKSWSDVEAKFSDQNYIEKISEHYMKRHGANNINNFILNNVSVSKNSGAREVSLKWELLSGNAKDFSGFFDYTVSTSEDLSSQEKTISLDGAFVAKGDLTNKKYALEKWMEGIFIGEGSNQQMTQKNSIADPLTFVKKLTGIADGVIDGVFSVVNLDVDYNSDLADFKISCQADDKQRITDNSNINFNISVDASIPVFKFVPASNIESHFIIQDLNCRTAEKVQISIEGNADFFKNLNNFVGSGVKIAGEIYKNYISKGQINYKEIVPESLSVSSGLSDASFNINYSLMHTDNKNYSMNNFVGIPGSPYGIGSATLPQPSTRARKRFGA